jgi:acetolactate synthase I/II/III large subunit
MKLRGADVIARTLAASGVRQVFTLSGNHVMPLFDAALDAKLSLIHVRHEAAAVHMADAWGRLTGEPGIALVTGGPGHANALGALYTALAAGSPMLLISGHAPLNELGKGAFQEMAQAELAKPLTVASWTAESAQDIRKALREARRGPVHLSVPNDVLDASVDLEIESVEVEAKKATALPPELLTAKRPLVIPGPAALHGDGRERLAQLEEESGIPVIAMESPRGVNDPALGKLAQVLAQADVVLLLDKSPDFTLRFGKAFAKECRVLQASSPLASFGAAANSGWRNDVRAALRYRPPEWASVKSRDGAVHPVELCRAAAQLKAAVLVCDGGEFGQWAQACLDAPRRIINGPAGSIGSALPFAIAAKLAFPDAPVVAMMGDGTFGFHMAEIDTAVRYGLNCIAVIGNDSCWNAEYQIATKAYGKERARNLDLLPTRYGAVAAAMGAHGEDVNGLRELGPALKRAAEAGKPACVNVMIERLPAPRY